MWTSEHGTSSLAIYMVTQKLCGLQQINSKISQLSIWGWIHVSFYTSGFLNSSAPVLAVDKVTDYSKGLLIHERGVTMGLSSIPSQAARQTEMPFGYFSSGFTILCWPEGEVRCPFDNTRSLKSSFFGKEKCKLLSKQLLFVAFRNIIWSKAPFCKFQANFYQP